MNATSARNPHGLPVGRTWGWPLRHPVDRFEEQVDRTGGPDACHIWNGLRNRKGYGVFYANGKRRGAHRFAWEFAHGTPPPDGISVCHRCDNPPCVNPSHLFLGTNAENVLDRESKGRNVLPSARNGELNPSAKISKDDVVSIQAAASLGERHRDIARRYGISRPHVSRIVNGVRWASQHEEGTLLVE